jgi:malate synthase
VPIYNLMEDAATAEICRAQVWQWVRHRAKLADGRVITPALVGGLITQQQAKLNGSRMDQAARVFEDMVTSPDFPEFLTLVAYHYVD